MWPITQKKSGWQEQTQKWQMMKSVDKNFERNIRSNRYILTVLYWPKQWSTSLLWWIEQLLHIIALILTLGLKKKKKKQCILNGLDRVAAYIPCNSANRVSKVQMIYVLNNLLQSQNAFVEKDGVGGLRKSFLGSASCFAARYFFAPFLWWGNLPYVLIMQKGHLDPVERLNYFNQEKTWKILLILFIIKSRHCSNTYKLVVPKGRSYLYVL